MSRWPGDDRAFRRAALRLAYPFAVRLWRWFGPPLSAGVRVLLVDAGEVVLVRHTYGYGWYLPGGGLDPGETFDGAARREAREEVGADLKNLHLFGAYTNRGEGRSDNVIVLIATEFSLGAADGVEIAEVGRFPLDGLPEGTSSGTRRRVAEYLSAPGGGHLGRW